MGHYNIFKLQYRLCKDYFYKVNRFSVKLINGNVNKNDFVKRFFQVANRMPLKTYIQNNAMQEDSFLNY